MKRQVWKFTLLPDRSTIMMPKGSEILSIQRQNDVACIWALVDPKEEQEERYFEVYGTGHEIHYDMGVDRKFIATFQITSLNLVFHVFERIN